MVFIKKPWRVFALLAILTQLLSVADLRRRNLFDSCNPPQPSHGVPEQPMTIRRKEMIMAAGTQQRSELSSSSMATDHGRTPSACIASARTEFGEKSDESPSDCLRRPRFRSAPLLITFIRPHDIISSSLLSLSGVDVCRLRF